MLPAAARVRTRSDHRLVAQAGCRVRRGSLIVSMVIPDVVVLGAPARAAAVAGRRVGPAVTRNRIKRRLRELLRTRLSQVPAGALVVIRALPGAEAASYAQLGAWVDAGIRGCLDRAGAGLVP